MHSNTVMTLVYTCWVVAALVCAVRGRPIHPFAVVACIMSPIAHMALNAPPGMATPVGQWLIAIVNVLGPVAVGMIVGIRHVTRSTRTPA
jgi:hypothetical protein